MNPCSELILFFKMYPERGKLCDSGAGQGRDSIPISKLGYDVTAVDISKVGLEQIKSCDLSIETLQNDVYEHDISGYDFILMDSMLHFYKNDVKKETALVDRILDQMKIGSVLVNNMVKSSKAEKILKSMLDAHAGSIEVMQEKYIDYPDFDATYHFIVLKKLI